MPAGFSLGEVLQPKADVQLLGKSPQLAGSAPLLAKALCRVLVEV